MKYDTDITRQTPRAQRLDVIVLLVGDDRRIEPVAKLYEAVGKNRKEPLPLVITGGHTGLKTQSPTQSQEFRDKLVFLGVDAALITLEEDSRDTLANIIYSNKQLQGRPLKVGLATSEYHMERSERFAARVWPTAHNIAPLASPGRAGYTTRVASPLLRDSALYDTRNIQNNDQAAWEAYLNERHPYHAPFAGNEPNGRYATLIKVLEIGRGNQYVQEKDRIIREARARS
jgi:uncharacterized SAM-binding protein YcdF (DUF218 family)